MIVGNLGGKSGEDFAYICENALFISYLFPNPALTVLNSSIKKTMASGGKSDLGRKDFFGRKTPKLRKIKNAGNATQVFFDTQKRKYGRTKKIGQFFKDSCLHCVFYKAQ